MQQLKIGVTNQFSPIFTTQGTGSASEAVFYRPIPPADYFVIGDYGQPNLEQPTGPEVTVTVIDLDPDDPMIKPPIDFQLLWNGTPSGIDGSFWQPIPPPNYVALGAVSQAGINKPNVQNYRCLRFDQVKPGSLGPMIWSQSGSNPVVVYQVLGTNTIYVQANLSPPIGPVYVPRET